MLCRRIECWKMLVGHLAVCSCLLLLLAAPTFSRNHTCHRTETVEVTVAVPLQEPATFRSYTWCLKVPPRCSKYTVIMRERITYETEVRNQTVSECCPGYVSLYGVCVTACPTCANMRCDTGRNCSCAPGFLGPTCNETCEVGKWGDRCGEACICRVGEDCDPISGSCTPSTSTIPPATALPTISSPSTTARMSLPSSSIQPIVTIPRTTLPLSTTPSRSTLIVTMKKSPPTPNTFINLTLTDPTTSAEDLTDFNMLRPHNDSVRIMNNNDEINSLNALGDLDYPVLPTDSVVETYNYVQPDHMINKNVEVNSLSVNGSVVNDRWISELGANSGVTLGSALALIALVVVTISAVVRCRNKKTAQHQASPAEKTSLHLVARNSHYAVPGPPPFSFINAYGVDLPKEESEESYDHPRSARCLSANEPIYDELRY